MARGNAVIPDSGSCGTHDAGSGDMLGIPRPSLIQLLESDLRSKHFEWCSRITYSKRVIEKLQGVAKG